MEDAILPLVFIMIMLLIVSVFTGFVLWMDYKSKNKGASLKSFFSSGSKEKNSKKKVLTSKASKGKLIFAKIISDNQDYEIENYQIDDNVVILYYNDRMVTTGINNVIITEFDDQKHTIHK